MTEPHAGSDPTLFKVRAELDGDEWVINGEKWFTSAGRNADLLFVMCTNGIFIVPRQTPGVEIMPEPRNHNHIKYTDVRVPIDHLLGPEDGAKALAQRRLGGGRIHHAMRTIAQCTLALDMMCERALSRNSHGRVIAEHQMVQEKIADSYVKLKMLRLYVLETAWKIDNSSTQETRTDIAGIKFTMARVLRDISFDALHIHGALGTTDLTPLQAMYAGAPTMGLADGPDEVHIATVARNVLKSYQPHEGPFPRQFIPFKREQAWQKMEPLFAARPELGEAAEKWKQYMSRRGR
jgi:alkylation response protein AidB-like acyl-CoA dehydrogenase